MNERPLAFGIVKVIYHLQRAVITQGHYVVAFNPGELKFFGGISTTQHQPREYKAGNQHFFEHEYQESTEFNLK